VTLPTSTLYIDGECALCSRVAWFIDRRDRVRTLRIEKLESDEGRALRAARHDLATIDSLIWVDRDASGAVIHALTFADAALAVGRYLGSGWRVLATISAVIPRPVRNAVYRLVARHRKRF
jgi:predicted DCC family thiol-disulfide oxidoreductase YuxK